MGCGSTLFIERHSKGRYKINDSRSSGVSENSLVNSRKVVLQTSVQESLLLFHYLDSPGLRDLRNFATLAQSPAVAPLLTRYRSFNLQFKFLSTKDDV